MLQTKRNRNNIAPVLLVLLLVAAFLFAGCAKKEEAPEEEIPSGPPKPAVESSLTIGSTGDILLHTPILASSYNEETGMFDFSDIFRSVKEYYESPDIMVANLEITLGGPESGDFSGYPAFNSPDSIVSALKDAGVDILLTANNHAYDTGDYGFLRTQDVLEGEGLIHIGTRKSENDRYIYVTEKNGIRAGFVCYTYDTREHTEWQKSLNGITMSDETSNLVNSFSYSALDEFYENARQDIYLMNMIGIEAKIFYLHWGNEYEDEPNELQQEIARNLCDIGVDVIIGGHPHVIQRFDLLESENGHQTACLYSMGNELSNQRAEVMDEDGNRGYTEDGLVFNVVFEKFNNGKVKLRTVEAIPTWVDLYADENGMGRYEIRPLNPEAGDFGQEDEWESYQRTIGRLGTDYSSYTNSR